MAPQDLGRQLRRARQHLGLSLRDVHALTAIPLDCVAALEEGDLTHLPSPVYARGYIRSYAEAVRLDGDRLALELWQSMEEAQAASSGVSHRAAARPRSRSAPPRAPTDRPPEHRRPRRTTGHRPSSLAKLRQPTSPWVPRPGRIRRIAPALERAAVVVLFIVLAVGIWDLQRARPVHPPTAHARAAAASQAQPKGPSPAPSDTAPPQAATFTATPVSDTGSLATYVTGAGHFSVVVQATDAACWLQVRAAPSGPVVFEGTLQPGQAQPFDANGTLWVRLGNLGHAALQVDGTPLTLPNKPSFPYNLLLQA
ncbi:MAG: helix-turn-helix domain-containing protein [Acidimicrobiia bacterium]|nr:helix-turn-helix domain-containing protein [Acidimicrobiia bacterium]